MTAEELKSQYCVLKENIKVKRILIDKLRLICHFLIILKAQEEENKFYLEESNSLIKVLLSSSTSKLMHDIDLFNEYLAEDNNKQSKLDKTKDATKQSHKLIERINNTKLSLRTTKGKLEMNPAILACEAIQTVFSNSLDIIFHDLDEKKISLENVGRTQKLRLVKDRVKNNTLEISTAKDILFSQMSELQQIKTDNPETQNELQIIRKNTKRFLEVLPPTPSSDTKSTTKRIKFSGENQIKLISRAYSEPQYDSDAATVIDEEIDTDRSTLSNNPYAIINQTGFSSDNQQATVNTKTLTNT